MVDMARFFLEFTQNESCGKCTFCRIGTKRMLEILDRSARRGEERRPRAARGTRGENPPHVPLRPRTDRAEPGPHDAEIFPRRIRGAPPREACPAKRCRALIRYKITDRCFRCTLCAQQCPVDAIEPRPYEQHEIDQPSASAAAPARRSVRLRRWMSRRAGKIKKAKYILARKVVTGVSDARYDITVQRGVSKTAAGP